MIDLHSNVNASVRPYRVDDAPACIAVFDSNVPAYFHQEERERFAFFLGERPGPAWVAYHGQVDDVVVFGAGTLADEGRTAWLRWGMVHAAWHRKGFGRLLLAVRLTWIAEQTAATKACVATTGSIHGFFLHHGFARTGTVPDGIGPGVDRYDLERVMVR